MQKRNIGLIVVAGVLLFTGASCSLVPVEEKKNDSQQNVNNTTVNTSSETNVQGATETAESVTNSKEGFKKYTNPVLGFSVEYPEYLNHLTTEDPIGLSLVKYYDQRSIDGTSGIEENGISISIGFADSKNELESQLATQRVKGVYQTEEQKKEEDASFQDSSFPQPILVSTQQITMDSYKGYLYNTQVKPPKRPVTEMTNYVDVFQYYVLVDSRVLTVRASIGFGEKHDQYVKDIEMIINSIQIQ